MGVWSQCWTVLLSDKVVLWTRAKMITSHLPRSFPTGLAVQRGKFNDSGQSCTTLNAGPWVVTLKRMHAENHRRLQAVYRPVGTGAPGRHVHITGGHPGIWANTVGFGCDITALHHVTGHTLYEPGTGAAGQRY